MSQISARLSLPYMQPAQAQKHITHNEALELLDMLVQLTCVDFDQNDPPAAPAEGEAWAVGTTPTGDWTGQAGMIAAWRGGGWIFVTPQEGWQAWGMGPGEMRVYTSGNWDVPDTSPDLDNLTGVGIGTNADAINRLAVASDAVLFTHTGSGHQLKLNKAGATDTASLLYQTGFSGRAEMGLAGDDDFAVKTSADGADWTTALRVSAASGAVTLGDDLTVTGTLEASALTITPYFGGDIAALVPGTNYGTLVAAPPLSNLVFGLRENGTSDCLAIVSGSGNFSADEVYDRNVACFHADGRVGLGIPSPTARLHIRDVMRLHPSGTPATASPGDIYFDSGLDKLRCFDGNVWHDLF